MNDENKTRAKYCKGRERKFLPRANEGKRVQRFVLVPGTVRRNYGPGSHFLPFPFYLIRNVFSVANSWFVTISFLLEELFASLQVPESGEKKISRRIETQDSKREGKREILFFGLDRINDVH